MMLNRILLRHLFQLAGIASIALASQPQALATESATGQKNVRHSIEQAWDITWSRFYRPDTHLFYDYLTSYQDGQGLKHLPTTEEIKRQIPNECGYGTGMEDCMISAGVLLSMILDRHAATNEPSLEKQALEVFLGMRLCATGHEAKGFLARGVGHQDLKSIYLNSSRDQYTHAVHGLWQYARSPLCSDSTKAEIALMLTDIADRMRRNVIPENDYDSLRADGSRDTRGISRMWNVKGHEAARLPMIYAAAWDITGNSDYRHLWRKYVSEAIKQSFTLGKGQPTYALLQMQISLELLAELETEQEIKQKIYELMTMVSRLSATRAKAAERRAAHLDLTEVGTDWRSGEGISSEGSYRRIWYCIRESGEAALAQLVSNDPFPIEQQEVLTRSITRLNYDRVSSNGIFFLQAAYWRNQVNQMKKE